MEIILTKQCESLTGSIGRGLGYSIRKRGKRFFAMWTGGKKRDPGAKWNFIKECIDTRKRLYISDIHIHEAELYDALYKAHHFQAAHWIKTHYQPCAVFNAKQVINLKVSFGL